jgi:hypothetical protein
MGQKQRASTTPMPKSPKTRDRRAARAPIATNAFDIISRTTLTPFAFAASLPNETILIARLQVVP